MHFSGRTRPYGEHPTWAGVRLWGRGNGGGKMPATDAGHHYDGTEASLNRTAFSATVHCLTGCAIGEVLGMVIGTALGWSNAATVALSVVLAFVFGYALTMLPLLRNGLAFSTVL